MPSGSSPSTSSSGAAHLHGEARARLTQCVAEASLGQGSALLVVGEAGIGKTQLLHAAVADAAHEVVVLRSTGHDAEVETSFSGLQFLLWPVRNRIEQLDRSVSDRLQAALGLGAAKPGDRFAIASATLALLEHLGPVACLIDDWHVLDASTRDVLGFVARRCAVTACALIIASRPDDAIGALDIPRLDLDSISTDDALDLASEVDAPVHRSVATRLVEATGGNTLAVLENVRDLDALQRAGRAPVGDVAVGPRLLAAFTEPLRRLDATERDALRIISLHADGDPIVLDRALEKIGLRITDGFSDPGERLLQVSDVAVRFRHPLQRKAVADEIPNVERRRLHRILADVFEELGDMEGNAVHLAASSTPPDEHVAAAMDRAAEAAQRSGDLAQAVARFERAAAFSTDVELRATRLLRAGAAATQLGPMADEILQRASVASNNQNIRDQATMLRALAASWRGDHELVAALAELALRRPGALTTWSDAVLVGLGTHVAWNALDLTGFTRRWRRLAQIVSTLEATDARGPALMVLVEVLQFRMLIDHEPLDDAMLDLLVQRVVEDGEIDVAPSVAFLLVMVERFDEAITLIGSLRTLAGRDGAVAARVWLDTANSFVARATGRSARTRANLARVRAEAEDLNLPWAVEVCATLSCQDDADRGDLESVLAYTGSLNPTPSGAILALVAKCAIGRCHLGRGEIRAAREAFEAIPRDRADALVHPFFHRLYPDLVECLVRDGDPSAAEVVAQDYARLLMPEAGALPAALLARVAGLTTSGDRATGHFVRALEHHDGHPDSFETARTQLAFGTHLRSVRQPAEARHHLTESAQLFDAVGADPWADQARHHALLAGAFTDPSTSAVGSLLTPQERAVTAEVVRGRRNHEIAATLFISRKTVEAHLTRIYRKLGIRSRTELIQWARSEQEK